MVSFIHSQEAMQTDYAFNISHVDVIGNGVFDLWIPSGRDVSPYFVACSDEHFSLVRLNNARVETSDPVVYSSEGGMTSVMKDFAKSPEVGGLVPLTRGSYINIRHLGFRPIGALPIGPKTLVPYFK